jgi:hypothetical protein
VEAITCYNNNSDVVVCHSFAWLCSHGDSTLADLLCLVSFVCKFWIEDVARRLFSGFCDKTKIFLMNCVCYYKRL